MVDPVAMDTISVSGMSFSSSDGSLVMFNFRDRRVYCSIIQNTYSTGLFSYKEHTAESLSVSLTLFLFFFLRTVVTDGSVFLWQFRKSYRRDYDPDALVITTRD